MDFIRNRMVTKKTSQVKVNEDTINQGMIHVFTQEVLKPNNGQILETYSLLGQPLLLVLLNGDRTMVALNPLYGDNTQNSQDKDMEKYYREEIKQIAGINNAKPFIAHFAVSHNHKSSQSNDHGCLTCLKYKGTTPIK